MVVLFSDSAATIHKRSNRLAGQLMWGSHTCRQVGERKAYCIRTVQTNHDPLSLNIIGLTQALTESQLVDHRSSPDHHQALRKSCIINPISNETAMKITQIETLL